KVVTDAAIAMGQKTGQPVRVLGQNAAADTSEATLVGHGVVASDKVGAQAVAVGSQQMSAKQLAKYLVNDANWAGGTLRLGGRKAGVPAANGAVFAKDPSAYLELLGSPTTVIAPQGFVSIPGKTIGAGLPVVETGAGYMNPGKGWTYH